uniref:Uncharacterized protein n=1 Tax=Ixodes ricinus TaxID=34613 RepID=A0A6B0UYE0_IXORI
MGMFVTLSVLGSVASSFRRLQRLGGVLPIELVGSFKTVLCARTAPVARHSCGPAKSIAPILLRRGICIQPRRGRHVSGGDISTGHRAHCSNDPRARSALFPEDPCVVTKSTRLVTTPAARSVSMVVASRIVFTVVCNRSTCVYRDVLPEGFWGVVALFVVSATKCR